MGAPPTSWILAEDYAGLRAQALGLAEAAGLEAETRTLVPRPPWSWVAAKLWPQPLRGVPAGVLARPWPDIVIGAGGTSAVVAAAMAGEGRALVAVQHPRIDIRKFRLVVVNRHDELTGPNVIVTRTALHRVTAERLAAERARWEARFAHLPRPLVAVLLGGSNGRFRLDAPVGAALAGQLAEMMARDKVGVVVTPSRRTDPAVTKLLADTLAPLGAYVWDMTGENPYFAMLALADAIIPTEDSVSMVSEAAATRAPVLLARLPGKSRRIGMFINDMLASGRVREFAGRMESWDVAPMNDTLEAGAEMRRRLGY
jgi:mitochondrial fission protein ELM1